jgi:hypothetical protein
MCKSLQGTLETFSLRKESHRFLLRGATLQTVRLTGMIPSDSLLFGGHIVRGLTGLSNP